MDPTNGKGSAPRKGADDKKYQENWENIFGDSCKTSKQKPGKQST